MRIKPVIVVVACNRAKSLRRLLDSIATAQYPYNDITLIISIDCHPANSTVIEVAERFVWEYGNKIVRKHETRMGLRPHVLECGDYALQYGCVIMLEDDLVVASDYYLYTIATQEYYRDDKRIAGIALYCNEWNNFSSSVFRPMKTPYDTYFRQVCESWGQSWTREQWESFKIWMNPLPKLVKSGDMPSEVYSWPETSWGKYFSKYVTEKNRFLVIPYIARSTCFSEVGQHTAVKYVCNHACIMNGIPKDYKLPKFENGAHYDMFFENLDLQEILCKWIGNEKCQIDINGLHEVYTGTRYVLSTKSLPFKIVHSFGLEMRPPEQNVISNIPGDEIFLYDKNENEESPRIQFKMVNYDLSGYKRKDLLEYVFKIYLDGIKRRIRRRIYK